MTSPQTIDQTDLDRFCRLKGLSELTPDIVRRHAPDALLVHEKNGRSTARASVWWRQVPAYGNAPIGMIGHYAALEGSAAAAILDASCRTLAEEGCRLAIGPIDGNTWRRYRLLTERGREPPFFLEPDNPDDWPGHFDAAGFLPLARYYSAVTPANADDYDVGDRIQRCEQAGYVLRPFDADHLNAELGCLWRLSCEGFAGNFLYGPISLDEFVEMYSPLLAKIRPELIRIVEWWGTPVAFCLGIPNLLEAQRGQPVRTLIIKSLAVIPEHRGRGLADLMVAQINRTARTLGMPRTIHALMHEDNPSRRLNRAIMHDFRTYTLYARQL